MLNLKTYQWEDVSNLLSDFVERHMELHGDYEEYRSPNWTDLGLHRLVERIVEVAIVAAQANTSGSVRMMVRICPYCRQEIRIPEPSVGTLGV